MSLVCTTSKRVGEREVCVDCGRTLSWFRFAFNPKKLRKEKYFQTPEGRAVLEMLDRRYPRDPRVLNWLLREYRRGRLQVSPQWLDHTRMLQHAEEHGDEHGQERANSLLNDTNRPDIVLWSPNQGGHPEPVQPGIVTGLGKLMDTGIPHSLSQDEDLKPEWRERLPAGQGLDLMNWQYPDLLPVYNTYSERYKHRDPDAGETVHQFPNGWSMRRLTSPDEAYVEGDEMQNCIPKFAPTINNGEHHVFSLRDQKNVPHTNILMAPRTRGGDWNGGIVRDIRAKQNQPPQEINPEYHQMVSNFLQSMNPQPTVRWDAYPPGNSPGEAGDYGLSYHPSWHELGHYGTMGGPAEFFDADEYENTRGLRQASWDLEDWNWDGGFIVTANWNKVRNQMRKNNILTPENYRKWSWLKNRFGMRPQMDANGNAVIDPETGNPSYEEHNTHLPYAEWLMREARKGGLRIPMRQVKAYEDAIQANQRRIVELEQELAEATNPGGDGVPDENRMQRIRRDIDVTNNATERYQEEMERRKRYWEDPHTVHTQRGGNPVILNEEGEDIMTGGRIDEPWLDTLKTILQRRGDTGQQNNIMKLKPHQLAKEVHEQAQLDKLLKHGGEVVHKFPDDWTLRRLNSGEAAKLEGDIMGHCIGSYTNEIENGTSLNYSLRDKRGFPHVTFEIKPQKPPKVDWDRIYKQTDQLQGPAICPDCGAEVDADGRCRNGHQIKIDPFAQQYTPEQFRIFHKIMDQGGGRDTIREMAYEPEAKQAFGNLGTFPEDGLTTKYDAFKKELNANGYSHPDPTGGHSYQIQGRGNVAPEPKYHKYIRDWVDSFPEEDKPLSVWSSYFKSKPVQYVEHLPDIDKGVDELGFKVQKGRDVDWNAVVNSANDLPPLMKGTQTSKSFRPNEPDKDTQYDPQKGQELYDWAISHEQAEPFYKSLSEWEKAKKPATEPGELVENHRGYWTREQPRPDGRNPRPEIYGRCTNCEADEAWHYNYNDGYYICAHCGEELPYDELEQRTPAAPPRALPRQGPAYNPYQASMVEHLGPQFEQYFSQQSPELYQWALHGAPEKVGFKCPNCGSSNVETCNQCGGNDHFICGDCGAWIPAPGRQGSKTAKSSCPYFHAHKRRRKHSSIVTGKPCPCLYTHADEDDSSDDGGSLTAHVKTADKLNDYLMNPQSRPDLQTPEAQNFLQHLQGSYHNENTDPLMPWITREWKKGRAFVPPGAATNGLVTKGLNDEWPAVNPARFNHWADWYNSNHPSRRGVDIMQMKAPDMHQKIQEWDAAMQAEQGGSAQNRGEIIHHWPDGWTVQNLTDDKSLKDEGDKMGHCVGGYGNRVRNGDSIIHSLRDENNEPHATIELIPNERGCSMCANGDDGHVFCDRKGASPHDSEIEQIQGKGNDAVKPEYAERLKDYFNEYYPSHDQKPKWADQDIDDYDELEDHDGGGYRTYHGDADAMGLDEPRIYYDWGRIVDPDNHSYHRVEASTVVKSAAKAGELGELIDAIDDQQIMHRDAIENQFARDFRYDPADTAERYGFPRFEESSEYEDLPSSSCQSCGGGARCPECGGDGEDDEEQPCSKCGGDGECADCYGYDGENPDWESEFEEAKDRYYGDIEDDVKQEAWENSEENQWLSELEGEASWAHGQSRRGSWSFDDSNSLRTAARGSHPHFSTGLLCHCHFTKHLDSKVATVKCQTCGDPLEKGAFCSRCDWGPHNRAEKQVPLDVKREQTIQAHFHSVIPEGRWVF